MSASTANQVLAVLTDALKLQGRSVQAASDELRAYAAGQVAALAAAVGQAGYAEAVQAAADNVALKAANELIGQADLADQRIVGMIAGGLDLGARLLAVGA